MATIISTFSEVLLADTRTKSGTVLLPPISEIPYRVLSFKDVYGSFSNSTLTLSTQAGNTFDDNTTSIVLSNAYSFYSLYAASTKWVLMNGTQSIVQSISTLNVNTINIGSGYGWIQLGPVQAPIVSTSQINTQSFYGNELYLGSISSQTAIDFFGLQGNYNNTVIAELSTGTGTQELLLFKGSSMADQVRIQTTGSIVFESGVSSRLWPSYAPFSTPTMVLTSSLNVGIRISSPQTTLDVGGTGRFQVLSSFQIFVSSINDVNLTGVIDINELASTVGGLGTANYISSTQLTSTTVGILNQGTIGFQNTLASTVGGLGTIGYVSSSQLASTVRGLGSAGYVSTASLLGLVSTPNLLNLVSTTFLDSQFASTIGGLAAAGYVSSSQLASTVGGLGSAGYLSSANILNFISTVNTVGGIAFNNLSTNTISAATISANVLYASTITTRFLQLPDITTFSTGIGIFQSTSYLYFGTYIVSPARVAPIQNITF